MAFTDSATKLNLWERDYKIILLSLRRVSHGLVRLNYLNASPNFIFGKKYWVQVSPSLPCLSFVCIELKTNKILLSLMLNDYNSFNKIFINFIVI